MIETVLSRATIMLARGYLPLHFMLKAGVTIFAVVCATAGPVSSKSESSASLAGSWTGGGWVSFASGNKERARCHAHYSRAGGSSYELNATCATASGKASQTALVHQTGANSFGGSFHNGEYNVSGKIHIVVHGNSQSVSLHGDNASASLSLSRH